jgi:hypothetical protein
LGGETVIVGEDLRFSMERWSSAEFQVRSRYKLAIYRDSEKSTGDEKERIEMNAQLEWSRRWVAASKFCRMDRNVFPQRGLETCAEPVR